MNRLVKMVGVPDAKSLDGISHKSLDKRRNMDSSHQDIQITPDGNALSSLG